MKRLTCVLIGCWMVASMCLAQDRRVVECPTLPTASSDIRAVELRNPAPAENMRVLPINLASSLQLAGSSPIDVQLAAERIRAAAAALSQAQATWLPTITIGGDYNRHDGKLQDIAGRVIDTNRNGLMFGAGTGIGQAAVFSLNDAIFLPLVARQALRVREADQQTAINNTLVAVTDAYFNVEQARGELAGALDATARTVELVRRVTKLAAGLVPPLEVVRAEAELARRQEFETLARERWMVASAELARILRLDASAQLDPLEPPHLQITLIDPHQCVDDLIAIGLMNRPELAANRAQVRVTIGLLRQEKLRPLMPSVLLRGWSTPVTGTLAGGIFAAGLNGNTGNPGGRIDLDLQLLWQLDNLGFGNLARVRQRESEYRAATLELFRIQDRVAAEVAQAYAQAQQSARRAVLAEREAKLALESFEKNLAGLGETRRVGELVQTIVRPQEVQAAVQALAQAYGNYYQAIADSNRAQFRLYRAMGQPAQLLGPGLPAAASEQLSPPHSISLGAPIIP